MTQQISLPTGGKNNREAFLCWLITTGNGNRNINSGLTAGVRHQQAQCVVIINQVRSHGYANAAVVIQPANVGPISTCRPTL